MKKDLVDIITMGCSKNLVDSEKLLYQLREAGYVVRHDPEIVEGEIVIINTCGFIGDAKEESINMILQCAQRKEEGALGKLFVIGCLSEKYMEELQLNIPQVDKYYGKFNWTALLKDLKNKNVLPSYRRVLTTPAHYAYLKISEGCDRHCAYCAIPLMTGKHRSRPMDEILDEVRYLVEQGVKEFQVIAQELTYYGIDLYGTRRIAELVKQMAEISGVEWIRLHYAYPTHFPMDLLRVMREKGNVCHYLDIALQHISTPVLQRMQRHITEKETIDLIQTFRKEIPDIHLRTTLMVGFPGETEEDFQRLMDFVRSARFERMGAFAYSEEEGTYAAKHYTDDVPDEVKQARLDELMKLQTGISTEINAGKEGKTFRVIVDREEGEYYIARTEFDSPEVDPEVLIRKSADTSLEIGNFYQVRITSSDEYDLYATLLT